MGKKIDSALSEALYLEQKLFALKDGECNEPQKLKMVQELWTKFLALEKTAEKENISDVHIIKQKIEFLRKSFLELGVDLQAQVPQEIKKDDLNFETIDDVLNKLFYLEQKVFVGSNNANKDEMQELRRQFEKLEQISIEKNFTEVSDINNRIAVLKKYFLELK